MERLMSEDPFLPPRPLTAPAATRSSQTAPLIRVSYFSPAQKSVGHVAGHDEASHCLLEAVTDVLEICRLHSGGIIEQMN